MTIRHPSHLDPPFVDRQYCFCGKRFVGSASFVVAIFVCMVQTTCADDVATRIQVSQTTIDYLPCATSYVALGGTTLLEVRPQGNDEVLHRSRDNGKTWEVLQRRTFFSESGEEMIKDRTTVELYFDPSTGLLLRIFRENKRSRSARPIDARLTWKIYTQFSQDQGDTWSPETQLIQKGSEYNSEHYAQNVDYGRTSAIPAGMGLLTLTDGTVIFPYYFWTDAEYREKLPKNVGRECGDWYIQACCFRGTWRKDRSGIDWDAGDYMIVPTAGSPCGSDEPTVALLENGSLLMITRSAGMFHDEQKGRHTMRTVPFPTTGLEPGRTFDR